MNYVNEQNMQEILDGIARKIGQGGGSGAGLEDWKPSNAYKENDIFVYNGQIYKSIVDFESDTTFSVIQILEEYELQSGDTPIAYAKGTDIVINDIVSYNSNYYKALYDFTCGEEFGLYAFEQYTPKELTEVQEAEIINHFMPNIYSGGNMSIEDSTPIGTIISFMGTIAPENYLVCDGETYNIADYIELAEFIKTQFGNYNYFGGDGITTFAVPDLQGEFLRMTGTNSHENQGSGANVGVHQDGTSTPYIIGGNNGTIYMSATSYEPSNADKVNAFVNQLAVAGSKTSTIPESFTSRPTNTSVLYCIKYKMSITNAEEIKDLTTEDIKQIVNSYNPVFEEAKGVEYSTEERRIGTWIDGKPLYQITIQDIMPIVTNAGTRVTKSIDISSLRIDLGVSVCGFAYVAGDKSCVEINSVQNINADIAVYCEIYRLDTTHLYADNLFIASSMSYVSGKPCYITLQYTKTTD